MKDLYEFIVEETGYGLHVYNLSYDIKDQNKKKADQLTDDGFALSLYQEDLISTDIVFKIENEKGCLEPEKSYFVIKPAQSTIIFNSKLDRKTIVRKLNEHKELDFAISELNIAHGKIENLIVNNYNYSERADEAIKNAMKEKTGDKSPQVKRMLDIMKGDQKSPITIKVQKM